VSIAITGGYVVPVDGEPIEGGTVLVDEGVIVAVGAEADVDVPDDAEIVDASGTWVLPGFVEAHGHVGVFEEGDGWAGVDVNEMTDPNGARLRALDGINPDDEGFRDALAGGVTTVVVKPGSGNPIGGQTVAVKSWGKTVDDMLVRQPVSVKSALARTRSGCTATRTSCRRPGSAWPR
jgi:imidazolonepropionase-like amidohydrolase